MIRQKLTIVVTLLTIAISITVMSSNNFAFAQQEIEKMSGVNMRGYFTSSIVENRESGEVTPPPNFYEDSFKKLSNSGIDFVRYLMYWEAYDLNPVQFVNEIKEVAQVADKYNIKIIYDNDQFATSSWLDFNGYGFPSFLFSSLGDNAFQSGGGGVYDNASQTFSKIWWNDWWNNQIKGIDGTDGWTLQAEFLKDIVRLVDNHSSTFGYEILNEPHVFSPDQWEKVGKYNTFITDELRQLTNKTIVFDRQVPSNIYGPNMAIPENIAKMAPQNKNNTLFKTTLYGTPTTGSYAENRLSTYVAAANLMDIPICNCEFNIKLLDSASNITALNQSVVNLFVEKFKEANVTAWAIWIWDFKYHEKPYENYNLILADNNNITTTQYFDYFVNAIPEFESPMPVPINDTISPVINFTGIDIHDGVNGSTIDVRAHSFDIGSGISQVQIKVDGFDYVDATNIKNESNWNPYWDVSLKDIKIMPGSKIIGKVIDNNGNIEYNTRLLNASETT